MDTLIKKWYLSRTVWLAVLQGIAGVITIIASENPAFGGILIAKSAVDIVLRFVTTDGVK